MTRLHIYHDRRWHTVAASYQRRLSAHNYQIVHRLEGTDVEISDARVDELRRQGLAVSMPVRRIREHRRVRTRFAPTRQQAAPERVPEAALTGSAHHP